MTRAVKQKQNMSQKNHLTPSTNPVETTQRLSQERKIRIRPVKGGVMLYIPEDAPGTTSPKTVLDKILRGEEESGEEELAIIGPADTEDNQ